MITKRFYLKEYFPELGENGCNAYMDAYIPSAFVDAGEALATKKYPCIVVCPGGGYGMTSDREAEPIVMQSPLLCSLWQRDIGRLSFVILSNHMYFHST